MTTLSLVSRQRQASSAQAVVVGPLERATAAGHRQAVWGKSSSRGNRRRWRPRITPQFYAQPTRIQARNRNRFSYSGKPSNINTRPHRRARMALLYQFTPSIHPPSMFAPFFSTFPCMCARVDFFILCKRECFWHLLPLLVTISLYLKCAFLFCCCFFCEQGKHLCIN